MAQCLYLDILAMALSLSLLPGDAATDPIPDSSEPISRPSLAPGKEHFRYLKVAIRK